MIPLKDDTPRLSTPMVNYFLIAANVCVYLFETTLGRGGALQFERTFGLIPARITTSLQASMFTGHHHLHSHAVPLEVAAVTILTSMFIHGGFWHVLPNMWFLWIFGRNLEDALGHFPYLVFYFTCGIAAALAQILSDVHSIVPTVGASGAIAGVMGGYFILYPRARVLMLVPFIFVFFLWLPAWAVLGYWIAIQFLSGLGTALLGSEGGGGIAFWAHVGGFVAGVLLVRIFPARTRRYLYID